VEVPEDRRLAQKRGGPTMPRKTAGALVEKDGSRIAVFFLMLM
jgi:hypothetical protein